MKKILRILICGIIILGIIGCTSSKNDSNIGRESKTKITAYGDPALSVKEGTLTSTGATVLLKNNGDKNYTYGSPYKIEKKEDDKWYTVKTINEYLFTMPAYQLKSGETKELQLDWKIMYGELSAGNYRIVKDISFEYEEGKYDTYNIAAEFIIDNLNEDLV